MGHPRSPQRLGLPESRPVRHLLCLPSPVPLRRQLRRNRKHRPIHLLRTRLVVEKGIERFQWHLRQHHAQQVKALRGRPTRPQMRVRVARNDAVQNSVPSESLPLAMEGHRPSTGRTRDHPQRGSPESPDRMHHQHRALHGDLHLRQNRKEPTRIMDERSGHRAKRKRKSSTTWGRKKEARNHEKFPRRQRAPGAMAH